MGARCPSCGQLYPTAGGYCANDGTKLIPTSPEANDALLGKNLDGRYRIQSPLAPPRPTAIGTMYRGYQVTVSREVAIKIIHPHYAQDVNAVERFLHAGRRAAQLVAPAVANVYDVGCTNDGILYVVSELARGRSLTDYAGHAIPLRRAVGIAIQLADALTAVHREHLVHGDLELASLVVDESSVGDQLKLLDVGLAAALGQRAFIPEILDGATPDPRSDLYAAGAIFYELLTGSPPFVATSPEALAGKHRRERPPQLPPHIPIPLATLIARLLAKHPAERYATATDLRAALVEVQSIVGAPAASNPGIALPRAPSNPNVAQPGIARTASADYGMQPRTASGNHPRPASEPAMPRTASGNYPPRTATPPAGTNYPHTATPPAGTNYPPHTATPPAGTSYPPTPPAGTSYPPPQGYPPNNAPAMARTASGNYPPQAPPMPRTATPPAGTNYPLHTATPPAGTSYPPQNYPPNNDPATARTASGNYPPTPPAGTNYPHTATPPAGTNYPPQPSYGNDPAMARTASGNYPPQAPAMPRTATPPAGTNYPHNATPPAGTSYPPHTATPPAGTSYPPQPSYGNDPAMARTASADYGMQPRTASGNYPPHTATPPGGTEFPAMARTASADYGLQPRTASGNYPPQGPPRTPSGDYPMVSRAASRDLAADTATASSSRRWIVIVLVALIASGGGIVAILLAG